MSNPTLLGSRLWTILSLFLFVAFAVFEAARLLSEGAAVWPVIALAMLAFLAGTFAQRLFPPNVSGPNAKARSGEPERALDQQ